MIAFVQPFSLGNGSGGGRILRSLLNDAPSPFVCMCTAPRSPAPSPFGRQIHIPKRPYYGRIEHTRFAQLAHWAARPLSPLFERSFQDRLAWLFDGLDVETVHAIPHGLDFWHAFQVAQSMGLRYVLNVHDDLRYNLANDPRLEEAMEYLGRAWDEADERIVISRAMGEAYNHRFGEHSYEVITDGLTELRPPSQNHHPQRIHAYFMGALHLSYHSNFEILIEALTALHNTRDEEVSLTLRGSSLPVDADQLSVEERPYAPEKEVWKDLNEMDVLYFPLPFGGEYDPFTRYSMSTKLVTYLGSGRPIVYNGPGYAAAAELLAEYGAAVIVDAADSSKLARGFEQAIEQRDALVQGAHHLGREHFWLADQRERFWAVLDGANVTAKSHEVHG